MTNNDENNIVLPLLPFETTPIMFDAQTGISSVTWYTLGGYENLATIQDKLKKRTKQVLEQNPWLAGRLENIDGKGICIVYPKTIDNVDDQVQRIFTINSNIQLSKTMSYNELSATVDPLLAKSGGAILKSNGNEPFWKVSLVVNSDDLCLITSLSHAIGDGHTYYTLHAMLSNDQPIFKLNPKRNPEITSQIETALGHSSALDIRFGSLCRLLRGALASKIRGPPTIKVFEVPSEWIAKEKNSKKDWVSTNDVVVSNFLNTLDADQAIMSVNFRDKLAELSDTDAGNYFQMMFVRPHDRETPNRLREAVNDIQKGCRKPKVPPLTSWEHLVSRKNLGMVSNWCSLGKPLVLENCSQTLHVPIVATDCLAMPWVLYGGLYMFQSSDNKIACMFGGSPSVWNELKATGMVGDELLG